MEKRKNPFHELYLTESIGPEKFVHLFSPFLVDKALALFEPGHVILKGLPGSGKSMLLNLLKPEIRIAFAKSNVPFPVPQEFNRFIGAGINLKRSGVSDFGHRPIDKESGYQQSPFFFADFLNYWVVYDILDSFEKLAACNKLDVEIGIYNSKESLNNFSVALKKHHCWNGYLDSVVDFISLKKKLQERIQVYRNFLNYNIDTIPSEIRSTKTRIGVPISIAADTLREAKLIGVETEVFVRIDQYEELAWLEDSPNGNLKSYQVVINELLGMRDSSVSYRIGTRNFAWQSGEKRMFGTTAKLENQRNYSEVAIDTVLRRRENRRTWIFPDFAEDILRRRINTTSLEYDNTKKVIDIVFGKSGLPSQKANDYVKTNKLKAIRIEKDWPKKWQTFLKKLVEEDPLSARLGEAWARQKGETKTEVMHKIPRRKPYPWDKQWWRKERIEQALLQIASRNNQSIQWYGKEDILSLSGGNILAFIRICRHIWEVWIRDTINNENFELKLVRIDKQIQAIGIIEASHTWFDDLSQEKGGKHRKLFIHFLGSYFYKKMVEDLAMSNPGHNGFSLSIEEFEKNTKVSSFLSEASDYGDLYDAPHTSKLKDKRERKKWYLNPILSPHFRIPTVHTKEPIYATTKEVAYWITESTKEGSARSKSLIIKTKSEKGTSQMKLDL